MNWLDFVLLAILVLSVAEGAAKGFARVGIGLAAAVAGLFLGVWFYGVAGSFLLPFVSSRGIANFIGFWLVFIGCLIVGGLLGKVLSLLFKWAGLTWLDRMLGCAFGGLRALIAAIALVLVLVAFTPKPPPRSVVNSRFAPYVIEAASISADMAPRELKEGFRESYAKVKQLWAEATKRSVRHLPSEEI